MAKVKFPLSGDVTQMFKFFTATFSSVGSRFGFINIYNAQPSAPEVEQEALDEVGSYGRQLGRISDVLAILVPRLEKTGGRNDDERLAIADFRRMVEQIDDIKDSHRRRPARMFSQVHPA